MTGKKNAIRIVLGTILATLALGCSSVPLSGRRRINMVSDADVLAMSARQYQDFIRQAPISKDRYQTERVRRVGRRIASATEQYLINNGLGRAAGQFDWEFNLVHNDAANAWCMPGGKIVFFEGILPYCLTDDDLATVMSHEVAHALAKHANERMSQQLLRRTGSQVLGSLLSRSGSGAQIAGELAYQIGSKVLFELPYSRQHELEADKIGLYLMAMAGYDYTQAPGFWSRMSGGRTESSDFLSTHPANAKRMVALEEELPRVEIFMRGDKTLAPAPVPERNRAATRERVVIPGNDQREVPLKTHY